nr:3-hydroxyacyl-CoA dehydrogenase [Vulcanisaeta sp. JCM 16159]
MHEDVDTIMRRIHVFDNLSNAAKDVDLAIEAVFEDPKVKHQVYRELEGYVRRNTIIASNTSGIPITYLQSVLQYKDRFAGFHWFNPPVLMRLVEVIKGKDTSDETANALMDLARRVGKEPILVRRDVRGFIANRVFGVLSTQSFILYMRGVYDYRAIDSALIYKLGLPMGVFALTDFTGGIKLSYESRNLFEEIDRVAPETEPSKGLAKARAVVFSLIEKMYKEDRIGIRTGKGFYEYPEPGKWVRPDIPRELADRVNLLDLLAPMVNESLRMERLDICTRSDIDKALKLGYNWPRGLFEIYGRDFTARDVVSTLRRMSDLMPDLREFYEPDPALLNEAK